MGKIRCDGCGKSFWIEPVVFPGDGTMTPAIMVKCPRCECVFAMNADDRDEANHDHVLHAALRDQFGHADAELFNLDTDDKIDLLMDHMEHDAPPSDAANPKHARKSRRGRRVIRKPGGL